MELVEQFEDAQKRVNNLKSRPGNAELLNLYALYKQGTIGDVTGEKPGRLDFKGRAKYEAWSQKKGLSKEEAMRQYIAVVDMLIAQYG
ncbi:MAG: acyl-CoA-binding protein [Bradymonadales bacterium]|nr:acyl-CoA-binding protein [Bradymonadales bacterium]